MNGPTSTPAERKALEKDPRWMVRQGAARLAPAEPAPDLTSLLAQGEPHEQLRACDVMAKSGRLNARDRAALLELLGRPLDHPMKRITELLPRQWKHARAAAAAYALPRRPDAKVLVRIARHPRTLPTTAWRVTTSKLDAYAQTLRKGHGTADFKR